MKRISLFVFIFLMFLFPFSASAHPGKTDENGGHYDQSTGEYHYHHGYPAHQHENGMCPYDFDDKTDHSNHGSSTSSSFSFPSRLFNHFSTPNPTPLPTPSPTLSVLANANPGGLIGSAAGGILFFFLIYKLVKTFSVGDPESILDHLKSSLAIIVWLLVIIGLFFLVVRLHHISPASPEGSFDATPSPTIRVSFAPSPPSTPSPVPTFTPSPTYSFKYIAHKKSMLFHYPNCETVSLIPESSREYLNLSRDELIDLGYHPCQRCHP